MTTFTLPEMKRTRTLAHAAQPRGTSLADLVGNTPLIRLRRITAHLPETVEVYAKAEWFNPGCACRSTRRRDRGRASSP